MRVYSANQAADLVGVSRATVYAAIRRGDLRAERNHWRCFVREDDLTVWLRRWQQRGRRLRYCRNGHDLWAPYVRYVAPSGQSCCRLCASARRRRAYQAARGRRLAAMPSLAEQHAAAFAALREATHDAGVCQQLQAGVAFWGTVRHA